MARIKTAPDIALGRRASLVRLGSVVFALSAAGPLAAQMPPDDVQRKKALVQARLQQLKGQYARIKTASDRYGPLKPSDPPELRKARADLGATMHSYEDLEREAQALHDKGGASSSLDDLGETESLRLQMTMDRMSKLMDTLSNIMKKMSSTGDAVIQNMK
ncbi:MAG: hypothetical protein ACHQK9_15435 [Reyranellales bacterium]